MLSLNKLSLRWAKFKFALKFAYQQFIWAYTDDVEKVKDFLDNHKFEPTMEQQFMHCWRVDTDYVISLQRELMAKEGLNLNDYKVTK
jgi:hypothetical protein